MKKMKSSRSRLYLWGGLLLMLMLGVMLAEYLIPWDAYAQDLSMAQQPPSAVHLLGTDRYGRDMLARVLVGGRTSIWGALVVVLLITAIGTGIGTGSGWYGGRIEQAWMGLSDVFLAFSRTGPCTGRGRRFRRGHAAGGPGARGDRLA